MIYAISDLHGDYEKYAAMLKKIQFSEADTLYVLGDVIDMGADGLRILMDMSARPNVFPIIGEHEFRALPLLRHLKGSLSEKTAANFDADTMRAFAEWGKQGGQETVRAFRAMPKMTARGFWNISKNLFRTKRSRPAGGNLCLCTQDWRTFRRSARLMITV